MMWLLVWFAAATLVALFISAATQTHSDTAKHRQTMKRAELCIEAAGHFQASSLQKSFIAQAYRLCDECGCPPDCWPLAVVQIHAGTYT